MVRWTWAPGFEPGLPNQTGAHRRPPLRWYVWNLSLVPVGLAASMATLMLGVAVVESGPSIFGGLGGELDELVFGSLYLTLPVLPTALVTSVFFLFLLSLPWTTGASITPRRRALILGPIAAVGCLIAVPLGFPFGWLGIPYSLIYPLLTELRTRLWPV